MRSPEYQWWVENERERMKNLIRSQRWRPNIGMVAIAVIMFAVAFLAIWTM